MTILNHQVFRLAVIASLTLLATACRADCEMDNPALQAMQPIEVMIEIDSEKTVKVDALHADDHYERSQGFQRVCAARIESTAILFDFGARVMPAFHMNNVVAPIDIAFIDQRGKIESIQSMQPYSSTGLKPLYQPSRPVVAALEVAPGFFAHHGISIESTITWGLNTQESTELPKE